MDAEQYRVEQVVDRVNTTGSVFMGLTMACAQCHSHKYDPLTQAEYYGMFAFFNTGIEKNVPAPLDAEVALFEQTLEAFEGRQQALRGRIKAYQPRLEKKMAAWEAAFADKLQVNPWVVLEPQSVTSAGAAEFTRLEDGSILVSGARPEIDDYFIQAAAPLERITGFRLEAVKDPGLPQGGPGRASDGSFRLSEFLAGVIKHSDPETGSNIAFRAAIDEDWKRAQSPWPTIDGDPDTHWTSRGGQTADEIQGLVFIADEPVTLTEDSLLSITLHQRRKTARSLGRFRLSISQADPEVLRIPPGIRPILATELGHRTDKQQETLRAYFGSTDPKMRELQAALDAIKGARPKLTTQAQILAENPDPPQTHIHIRGDFLSQGEAVKPHVPAVLPPLKARAEKPDRLDLARWLVHPDHPLTGRVAANRIWEHLFGRGLVNTSEDFGTRGERPSHPALLDWLASEYMAQGWSRKALIRRVVSSATYRQASRLRPALQESDPMNLLLARQNRFRVEAETIRDLFLSASGLLNASIGGPSAS